MKSMFLAIAIVPLACACGEDNPESTALSTSESTEGLSEMTSRTPPAPTHHVEPQPLQTIDELSVTELREFLAGKQLEPPGIVPGTETFETDGRWLALTQAYILVSQEGFWEVRLGSSGSPELCTTEIARDRIRLPEPVTVCRMISVSVNEGRAELTDPRFRSRKYHAAISDIPN